MERDYEMALRRDRANIYVGISSRRFDYSVPFYNI